MKAQSKIFIVLEDANETNGALKVIAGGHKLSPDEFVIRNKIFNKHFPNPTSSEQIGFINSDLWNEYQNWVYQDCLNQGRKVETVTANRGDIIIWHPMLPQGGSKIPNKGNSRYSMVMHVTPADTQVHGCYLYFAPQLPFNARQMRYNSSNSSMSRRFFENDCGFMKDE
jgi:ectoine hydroxylase-related dioxygenase (phytanoyl-CoA dioxygenase family)